MAPNVSKNAKTNRGSNTKYVLNVNGKEIEVCPARFDGSASNMRKYTAIEDKASKMLILDSNGVPLNWYTTNIEKKKS